MNVRVAVNGFGRTGRAFLRSALLDHKGIEIVAVNDLAPPRDLARLLARDSVHGRYPEPVYVEGDEMVVGESLVQLLAEPEVAALPWRKLGIDVVVESTGRNTARAAAAKHLDAGAKRVVISAPAHDADFTLVLGSNEDDFDPRRHFVISNASCTTNCLALLAKVLDDNFGIEDGLMTTVHAYTGDQRLVDSLHKDPRRSRAAGLNIVPTTTGAARATGAVLPGVGGHLDGLALRVPVADGSLTDLVAQLPGAVNVEQVNLAYSEAARSTLAGLLEYSDEPLVSTDIVGSTASCVFDSSLTLTSGRLVKVLGWYDNETGYSSRLADLVELVAMRGRI